ncbi:hypothetical protein VTN00DRAFT_8608 [Thermoascus crustaceus]
MHCKLNY